MPAFQEDFLDTIVNVGWGGGYLALSFIARWQTDSFSFNAQFDIPPLPQIAGKSLLANIGPIIASGSPNPKLLATNNFWCYPPKSTVESSINNYTFIDIGLYGILTNLGVVVKLFRPSLDIAFPTEGSPHYSIPAYIFWTPTLGAPTGPNLHYTNISAPDAASLNERVNIWSNSLGGTNAGTSGQPYLLETILSHTVTDAQHERTNKTHTIIKVPPITKTGDNKIFSFITPGNGADPSNNFEWTLLAQIWSKPLFTLGANYVLVPGKNNELLATAEKTIGVSSDNPETVRKTTVTIDAGNEVSIESVQI